MSIQPISRMPNASLDELDQVAAGMQEYVKAASFESREAALDAMNRRGVMQRLFPTQYEKEERRNAVQTLRQLSDAKRDLLEISSQVQIEIARKQADALIATQGVHLQAQLARFATEKIQDLNSTINRAHENFLKEMDPQFEMVQRFEHRPELAKPAYKALLHQISVYYDSTSALLDGFIQSLRSKIGSVPQ
ncbi:hypothetical protein AB0J80_11825 [Actinoplanes sp. NPDC049548]|uniref:hypothetical protein n=1 Tax=Actinoplanes sp. NPDC049548 TaxID=3155152 RepID=UPI00344A3871